MAADGTVFSRPAAASASRRDPKSSRPRNGNGRSGPVTVRLIVGHKFSSSEVVRQPDKVTSRGHGMRDRLAAEPDTRGPKLDQISVSQTGTREASAIDRQTIAPHAAHIEDHELRIGRSLYECMMAMHVGVLEPQIVFLISADTHQLTGDAQAAPSGTIHVDPRVGKARQGGCIRSPARAQGIGLDPRPTRCQAYARRASQAR